MHGITTSIRLTPKLRAELEKTAEMMHRSKNWIIVRAQLTRRIKNTATENIF